MVYPPCKPIKCKADQWISEDGRGRWIIVILICIWPVALSSLPWPQDNCLLVWRKLYHQDWNILFIYCLSPPSFPSSVQAFHQAPCSQWRKNRAMCKSVLKLQTQASASKCAHITWLIPIGFRSEPGVTTPSFTRMSQVPQGNLFVNANCMYCIDLHLT